MIYFLSDLKKILSSQQENNIILLSSIVPRKGHLDKKGTEVNTILEKRCNEMNLAFATIAIMTAWI